MPLIGSNNDQNNTNRITPNNSRINSSELEIDIRRSEKAVSISDPTVLNGSENRNRVEWKSNVLSDYDNYTYHLKFFIVSEDRLIKGLSYQNPAIYFGSLPGIKKVIIAESGVTGGISIKKFQMTTIVAPNAKTRNTTSIEAEMELFRPIGFSFIDKLVTGAYSLGIRNYFKMPVFVEIKFHGYDVQGNYVDGISPEGFNRTWLYRMLITDINIRFDITGSTYDVKMIQYDDIGLMDSYFRLEAPFNPQSVKLGDISREIVLAKETEEKDNYGYVRNKYEIVFLPLQNNVGDINVQSLISSLDPSEWRITNTSLDQPSQSISAVDPSKKEVNFQRGQSIESILMNLFANTREGQALTRRSRNSKRFGDESEYIVVWWIVPYVTIREDRPYDWTVNDYNRKITYYVKPYLTTRGVGSVLQHIPMYTKDTQKLQEKFEKRVRANRLKKRYDYLYTGLNTEVISVDLNFDMLWKATLPIYGGNNSFGLNVPNLIENDTEYLSRQVYLEGLFSRINKLNLDIQRLQEAYNNQDPNLSPREFALRQDQLQSLKYERDLLIREAEVTRIRQKQYQENKRVEYLKNLKLGKNNIINYLEDLDFFTTYRYFPITIDKSSRLNSMQGRGSVRNIKPIEQSMTTAILNQLNTGNMLEIDMKIKGDPYWLGYTHMETNKYLGIGTDEQISDELPAFNTGEFSFLLRFKMPKGIDPVTGEYILFNNEVFTGIYCVKTVTHEFNNGVFTQILSAFRDVNIDINSIIID